MKTTVKTVLVTSSDRSRTRSCLIRTESGDLMTHRLRLLISRGNLVWHEPYTLLQEIVQNRIKLQHELLLLEGESELTLVSPILILPHVTNFEISMMMWRELELRKAIKARIKEIKDAKKIPPPVHDVCEFGGWTQP